MSAPWRPLDVVLERMNLVHDGPTKVRARSHATGSHGGTLAIREASDKAVLRRLDADGESA